MGNTLRVFTRDTLVKEWLCRSAVRSTHRNSFTVARRLFLPSCAPSSVAHSSARSLARSLSFLRFFAPSPPYTRPIGYRALRRRDRVGFRLDCHWLSASLPYPPDRADRYPRSDSVTRHRLCQSYLAEPSLRGYWPVRSLPSSRIEWGGADTAHARLAHAEPVSTMPSAVPRTAARIRSG